MRITSRLCRAAAAAALWLGAAVSGQASAAAVAITSPAVLARQLSVVATMQALPRHAASLEVEDLTTGRVLYAHRPEMALPPASTLKLVVSAAALTDLGPRASFTTRVEAAAPIGGVVRGNLYLVGDGDPSLTLADLARLAAVVSRRVHRIMGAVVGDGAAFTGPVADGWQRSYFGYNWGAVPAALVVARDQLKVRVVPARVAGEPPLVREVPADVLPVRVTAVTGSAAAADTVTVSRAKGSRVVTVSGTAPLGRPETPQFVSVPDGPWFAALEFARDLEADGVQIAAAARSGSPRPGSRLETLAAHTSFSLDAILQFQNRWSINLYAENLLEALGGRMEGGPGSVAKGLAAVAAFDRRLGIPPVARQVDGSGLSSFDRASAAQEVALLAAMGRGRYAALYRDTLDEAGARLPASGILGDDGLLTAVAPGSVYLKTGNVLTAANMAGYARAANGHWLAFAFLVTGEPYALPAWRVEAQAITALTEWRG
jgi:D-alanyl-D-alanine carboxypeptidase/D-alanyl-D-alanine-endopeptidase (penicillin-binding protein 4)